MANRPPPDFVSDSDFPLHWCNVKGKLHCDKANVDKFPRPCPFPFRNIVLRYKTYDTWQKHITCDHNCKVTLTYTEEQKKEKRDIFVRHYVATKRSAAENNRKQKNKKPQIPEVNEKVKMSSTVNDDDNGDDFDSISTDHGFHTDVPSSDETLAFVENSKKIQNNAGLLGVLTNNVDLVTADQGEQDDVTERPPAVIVHYHGSRLVPRKEEDGGPSVVDEECAAIFAHVDATMIPFHDCAFYPGTFLFKARQASRVCDNCWLVTDGLGSHTATFDPNFSIGSCCKIRHSTLVSDHDGFLE
jgi:hypothetical protein